MACSRKSGVVSISTERPSYSTSTDGRVRRSCGSEEVHTRQLHPIVGTPIDVPLPSTVRMAFISRLSLLGGYFLALFLINGRRCSRLDGGRGHGVGDLDPCHPQFKEYVLQQGLFPIG